MTLVGIISDTHGSLDPRAYCGLAGCDVIIHAGDIGGPEILDELRTLAPVHAVLGNNDYDEYGPDVKRVIKPVIDGVRFLVGHYPWAVSLKGAVGGTNIAPGEPYPAVCIHGHTHVPRLEKGHAASPAQVVMNPGSVTRPRGGSVRSIGKILIQDGTVTDAWIEDLSGNVVEL